MQSYKQKQQEGGKLGILSTAPQSLVEYMSLQKLTKVT
jgi:hypothetical protein